MINLSKSITLNEWLFALGIYPLFKPQEKYELFMEMTEAYINAKKPKGSKGNTSKKLSKKKKASFAFFLEETNISEEMVKYKKNGIKWITLLSKKYPTQLRQINAPPVLLFYKGDLDLIEKHTWLGVTGTRTASKYGIETTEKLLSSLMSETTHSIGVVSGLADGIETKAHQTVIEAGGKTIGVIGTGLDQFYPPTNRFLQENIADGYLLFSEYPLGTKPLKYHFPERNRIIAGLSRGVLIIEAQKRSGSLITAYRAIDENRDIFVVPGSILTPNFEGSHRLIQLGGILAQNSVDILREWAYI